MSYNHANIVWQNEDGTWSIGFYTRVPGAARADYDSEWDDDYDYDSFQFVSQGHRTETSAKNSWTGSNPGSHDVMDYSEASKEDIAYFNKLASFYFHPELRQKEADEKHIIALQRHLDKQVKSFEGTNWVGLRVTARFKHDEKPYDGIGMSWSATGSIQVDDEGWWTVESNRIFNPQKQEVNDRLVSAELVNTRSTSRYVYRR
jgi:hypothetical protein